MPSTVASSISPMAGSLTNAGLPSNAGSRMHQAAAPRILVADDQADVLEALRLLLKGEGYQIDAVTSPAAVVTALEARDFDVVIMDLNYTRDTTSVRAR